MDEFLPEIYRSVEENDFQTALALTEQHEFNLLEQYLGESPSSEFYELLLLLTFACDDLPSVFHLLKRAGPLPPVFLELYEHWKSHAYAEALASLAQWTPPATLLPIHTRVREELKRQALDFLERAYVSLPHDRIATFVSEDELCAERNWRFDAEQAMWYPATPSKAPAAAHYGIERLAELTNIVIQAEML